MTEQEKKRVSKAIVATLAPYDLKDQRKIVWNLLRGLIAEDADGVAWLYVELSSFVQDEFNL